MFAALCLCSCLVSVSFGAVLNIQDRGAIPDDDSMATCFKNAGVMNSTLAALQPGDTLYVPEGKKFWLIGGIYAKNIQSATIQIDGELHYTDNRTAWPTDSNGHVKECMYFEELNNVTFMSLNPHSQKGLIDGHGQKWWGAIKYLLFEGNVESSTFSFFRNNYALPLFLENRPRLMHIYNSKNLLVDNIYFKDSPYWTFDASDVRNLEIRFTNVSARRTDIDYHDIFDMTAFNTDGFDVSGSNIWIHDCEIWNDDGLYASPFSFFYAYALSSFSDCIAVKGTNGNGKQSNCSENMVFERLNASGVGLTIGSIGPSTAHTCVKNITFRDIYMHRTFVGFSSFAFAFHFLLHRKRKKHRKGYT